MKMASCQVFLFSLFFLFLSFSASFGIVLHTSLVDNYSLTRRELRHLYRAKSLAGCWKIGSSVLTVFYVVYHVVRHKKALLAPREKVARTRSNVIYIKYNGIIPIIETARNTFARFFTLDNGFAPYKPSFRIVNKFFCFYFYVYFHLYFK